MNLSNVRWCAGVFLALAISLNLAAAQEFPPLEKGGQGGFSSKAVSSSAGRKSPSVPLFQRGKKIAAQQFACVILTTDSHKRHSLPVALGDTLRVKFRHSIYGSRVEEIFLLRRDGFELIQLRYSEARLVGFYGHDKAEHANGAWIVTPAPTLIPALSISLSADAAMSLQFDNAANSEPMTIQPTGALRLTVASCQSSAHG